MFRYYLNDGQQLSETIKTTNIETTDSTVTTNAVGIQNDGVHIHYRGTSTDVIPETSTAFQRTPALNYLIMLYLDDDVNVLIELFSVDNLRSTT